ncbi:MAG TPA: ATP-binding protein [Candidatus Saccharimonadales bacterium]
MVKGLLARSASAKQAKLEHERLTSLVNSMADGVLAVNEDMKIVLSNGAALNILDINSTLRGHKLSEVIRLQDKNRKPIDVNELVAKTTTPTSTRELLLAYSDHSTINLYLSIAPVHLGYGKAGKQGYVLLLRDITHEKSLEEERDEFISVVSHELRTPIAIAEGNISNAQFITEKSGDIAQVKQALKEAHNQILFLAAMINDLATLSRAERGKLAVDIETIDIPSLMAELKTAYSPQAADKDLKFEVKVTKGIKNLQSTTLYVREILQNFITNAIKYTDKGSVTVTAKPAERGMHFVVTDTGIGISKGDQERIFDKFFRSEDYRTRKTNGTGLGLYVTMKLARLIHAELEVQSELDKGSTFSIFIPDLGERD